MPIYEWRCDGYGHVFEVLTSSGAANRRRQCPGCGANSKRVISTFAIHAGATMPTSSERAAAAAIDVTKLNLPSFARPCAMDDYSATRLAAHKVGRGAEFDDKMATGEQNRAARGEPAAKPIIAKAGHSHKSQAKRPPQQS